MTQVLRRAGADPAAIRGFIGLSGPYVLNPNSDVLKTIFAAPYTLRDWQPIHFVTSSAPPTLLFQGLDDRVVGPEQTSELAVRLREAGVPAEVLKQKEKLDRASKPK